MKNYILTGEPHGSDFSIKNDGKMVGKNVEQPHDVKLKIHISYSNVGAFTKRLDGIRGREKAVKVKIESMLFFHSAENKNEELVHIENKF